MNVTVNYEEGAAEFAKQLFGRSVSDEELAAAVGALDGAVLQVSVRMKGQELHVDVFHPQVREQRRGFRRDRNGELYIWNHRLEKTTGTPPGFGAKVLMRQVAGARKLGIKRIELWAAGNYNDAEYNGYYTWARFGFDAPLTQRDRRLLPPELAIAQTLNDLIRLGAVEWWRRNGDDRAMTFDLAEDSSMMGIFRTYLKEKGFMQEG